MDFDSREALWASFINKEEQSVDQETSYCKICTGLEILKLSVCRGNCGDCEKNLIELIFPDTPTEILEYHLNSLRSNMCIYPKLLELEKKIPFYNESYTRIIEELDNKISNLSENLEDLFAENKSLKIKLILAQEYSLEYKEKYEKYLNEIQNVKKNQEIILWNIEEISKGILSNKDIILEIKKMISLDEKIERLDNFVIEEYNKVDELWENVQKIKNAQKKVESNHNEIKAHMQHCKNLDNATENILNYHHEIILSQKKIDYALQELLKGEKESKAETSDEFRNKIIELRKKTNEYMLKVN